MTLKNFWERVNKTRQCWLWTGPLMKNGYGKGCRDLVHRLSWKIHHGPIPASMSVLHRCDNRRCVNPDHLFLGTQRDNLRDMREKGRQVRGEQQGSAKLTEQQVRQIRRRYQRYSHRNGGGVLAREYGVGIKQIIAIAKGRVWCHVR